MRTLSDADQPTEDEIVTLIKANDYGYRGLSLLSSGANDRIFSRQKVEFSMVSLFQSKRRIYLAYNLSKYIEC